jgi:hypothetical protein
VVASEKVDEVLLKNDGKEVHLKFENGKWRVNDHYDADNKMIKVLFATVSQAEPRRPVATAMADSVTRQLARSGTRVLLMQGGNVLEQFTTGGNALKTEAWFVREGEHQPYVMTIPGYRVYVSGIFELDESGWRNKRIFDFNWRNFKSLTASYAKDKEQDFEIEMKNRYFGIKGIAEADTTRLNNYLDAVSLLFATRFIPITDPKTDSLAKISPAAQITVTDIGRNSYSLELFASSKNDREIYGRLGNGEIVALDKNDVGEIIRRKDYFRPRSPR